MAVPVIDIGNLNGEDRAIIMAQISKACEEWGFFQLLNHGIPHSLLERVKKVCSENYQYSREQNFSESLPVQMLNNALLEAQNNGTQTAKKIETTDWEDVIVIQHLEADMNGWPSQPGDFRETMEEFGKEIKKLAEQMLEVVSENLGLEEGYIKQVFEGGRGKPFFGTKVSHYPRCPRPDLVQGLRAHTDAGGLILLFQDDEIAGLEVLKDGSWIGVQPIRNAIVINIGDQLEVVSNGKYRSAWHRVVATRDGNRQSVASFYNPSFYAMVHPAPQLVLSTLQNRKEEDPDGGDRKLSVYPKFLFADYMNVYVQQKYLPKELRFRAMRDLNI